MKRNFRSEGQIKFDTTEERGNFHLSANLNMQVSFLIYDLFTGHLIPYEMALEISLFRKYYMADIICLLIKFTAAVDVSKLLHLLFEFSRTT